MLRKNKNPAGFSIGKDTYIRTDVVIRIVKDIGKHAIGDYDKQAESAMQVRLDEGDNIDVRAFRELKKENMRNYEAFLDTIVCGLEAMKGEE